MRMHKIKKGLNLMSPLNNPKQGYFKTNNSLYQKHRDLTGEVKVLYSGGELKTQLKAESRNDNAVFLRPISSLFMAGCEHQYKTLRGNNVCPSLSGFLAPSHPILGVCFLIKKNLKEAYHG